MADRIDENDPVIKDLTGSIDDLAEVIENQSQRIDDIAAQLATQPAAPAATPELRTVRTDGISDLPDPVIMVTEGGIAVDRVKRTWLNINQLGEDERDLDATGETSNSVRQASIPQKKERSKTPFNERIYPEQPASRGFDRMKETEEESPQPVPLRREPEPASREAEPKPRQEKTPQRDCWAWLIPAVLIFAAAILAATILYAGLRSANPVIVNCPETTTTNTVVPKTNGIMYH